MKKVRIRAAFMSNIAAGTITSIVAGILLKSNEFYRLGHCISYGRLKFVPGGSFIIKCSIQEIFSNK